MVTIIVTSSYPPHQADKVGKMFVGNKVPEVADFIKRLNVWVSSHGTSDRETKNYALYEAPNDKMYEAIISISTRYAGYREIEGFRYQIEPLIPVQEALPLIGLG